MGGDDFWVRPCSHPACAATVIFTACDSPRQVFVTLDLIPFWRTDVPTGGWTVACDRTIDRPVAVRAALDAEAIWIDHRVTCPGTPPRAALPDAVRARTQSYQKG